MKMLVYADAQADTGSEILFNSPGQSLRLWCVEKLYKDLARIYAEHHCNALCDLGDTFDNRSSIDHPTMNTVLRGLEWLPPSRKNVRLIGNHDQYMRAGDVHNGPLLDRYFHTVDTVETVPVEDGTLFYVSYPADYAKLTEWLLEQGRKIRGRKMLFGHFQVQGAFYKGGTAMTGVPKETLKPFSLVLLGHIHLPQAVTPKIHYIGSPFQQDWGETGQQKRVAVVDTATMTVEWVPLSGYPEYKTVTLDQFKVEAAGKAEHRYKVTLSSQAEAEEFFNLPNSKRGDASYNYVENAAGEAEAADADWSFEGTCRRYLKMVPPEKVGIDLSTDEMIDTVNYVIK